MLSSAALIAFPAFVVYAVMSDILTMKIPNKVVLAGIVGFLIIAPVSGMPLATIGDHVAAALVVLVVGFGLFCLGGIGAGDIKFASACALWLGAYPAMEFVVYTGVFGGLLTIMFLVGRGFALPMSLLGTEWIERLHSRQTGIPYGIAIGLAALFTFPESIWIKLITAAG